MSSIVINRKDSIHDVRSLVDVGVQVDLISQSLVCKPHQFVDLGYDSLHSTPKQRHCEQKTFHSFEIIDDGDDSVIDKSYTSKLKKKFSKLNNSLEFTQICLKKSQSESKRESRFLKHEISEEKVPERLEWSKKIDFLLSIIGFAVDLANVWRFPYLCYKNGGGVFLIPYTTMLIFGAIPLLFLELSLGQFTKSGPISMWEKICPPLKGIGYCCVLISWYVSFYYNVIIGWTTYFIYRTLTSGSPLPWQTCNNPWNTDNCFSSSLMNSTQCTYSKTKSAQICTEIDLSNRSSPSEEFFEREVLQINKSAGLSDMGTLRPELVLCVIIVFCCLYFSLFKGVKSSGKVVWFTATAPYFILTILLIRGLFLPGAGTGILYYIYPRLDKLSDPSVWVDAAVQVFFSTGVGFGVHLTYASFNKFNNNCYRDTLITASVNSLTSLYSGFVIFTYLGYMAHSMNKEIQNVASEGYGLVFQVYPEALSTLPFAKIWSLLFFVMLITLGIDSAMGGLEAVITGLMDEFKIKIRREYFTIIIVLTSFTGALINCTQGGGFTMYWFDTYSAGISLLCSAMFEAMAVTYIYGLDRFCEDIKRMIGIKPSRYWQLSWKYISPCFLSAIIILSIINSESLHYHNYNYPMWATVLGWMLTASSVLAIPVLAIIWWIKQRRNINENVDEIRNCNTILMKNNISKEPHSPTYV